MADGPISLPPVAKAQMEQLIELVAEHYGYDFRNFSQPTLMRRVQQAMRELKINAFEQLLEKVVADSEMFLKLLEYASINVTELFREPDVFLFLRQHIFPRLATYPNIRIWSAGTASGEEAYSLAILLHETGLADRAQIYATDFNPVVVRKAAQGMVALEKMPDYTRHYQQAGGIHSLSRYYSTTSGQARFSGVLKDNIVFSTHNLINDGVFNEFQLVLCRNVLIYFNKTGQVQMLKLLNDSLAERCYLCLGKSESMQFKLIDQAAGYCFDRVSEPFRVYRRCG